MRHLFVAVAVAMFIHSANLQAQNQAPIVQGGPIEKAKDIVQGIQIINNSSSLRNPQGGNYGRNDPTTAPRIVTPLTLEEQVAITEQTIIKLQGELAARDEELRKDHVDRGFSYFTGTVRDKNGRRDDEVFHGINGKLRGAKTHKTNLENQIISRDMSEKDRTG